MGINPRDFEVTTESLRTRLSLSSNELIFPYGYEGSLNDSIIGLLKSVYNSGSLFVRTRPDYLIIEGSMVYFVEAKQRTKNVEAIQLYYNKQYERMGIKVLYSFPELAIRASAIPMETVIIPENYSKDFDNNLKHLFIGEGITDFRYVRTVTEGSGDAFVPVELEDLRILSEELTV